MPAAAAVETSSEHIAAPFQGLIPERYPEPLPLASMSKLNERLAGLMSNAETVSIIAGLGGPLEAPKRQRDHLYNPARDMEDAAKSHCEAVKMEKEMHELEVRDGKIRLKDQHRDRTKAEHEPPYHGTGELPHREPSRISDSEASEATDNDSGEAEVMFKGRKRAEQKKSTPESTPASEMQVLRLRSPSEAATEDSKDTPPAPANILDGDLLAERIFALVSPHDLLLSVQLVCKHWSKVIFNSQTLRQKLFLEPMPGPTATLKVDLDSYDKYGDESEYTQFVQTDNPSRTIRVTRNPFMTKLLLKDLQAYEGYDSPSSPATLAYKQLPSWRKHELGAAEASYCYMLAFQPPVTSAHFLPKGMVYGDEGWPDMHVVDRKEEGGVKIWDMVLRKELRGDYRREALEVKRVRGL